MVPYAAGAEDEQTRRARRLEALGAVRLLPAECGDGARLAREMELLLHWQPAPLAIDLNGAENTTCLIHDLLRQSRESVVRARRASARRCSPAGEFFVRNDDVGRADEQLFTVLDIFADVDLPIDLAVIPRALTPRLAERLLRRSQRIGFHQHGFAHVNHEPEGRKCEFGPARPVADQRSDIACGRERLKLLFGPRLQPMFTPPWNRCTPQNGECLRDLGFAVLSRDTTAGQLNLPGLLELPITFDWFASRKGIPLSRAQRAELLAQQIATSSTVGLMLHHAQMDATDLTYLRELLQLLAAHPQARVTSMARASRCACSTT